ncbi:TIGR00153 family protein [Methanocaldococcus indicus]|uniref:TIGR00153 family protein n=1 Tax=Methanocaldococcus indicus TaxID=213231 RepID=UPI003C6CDC23
MLFIFKKDKESEILNKFIELVDYGIEGIELIKTLLINKDKKLVNKIIELEEKGDTITRYIRINLSSAFLPNIRRELSKATELLDETLDNIKHSALIYNLFDNIYFLDEVLEILNITKEMYVELKHLICVFEHGGDFDYHLKKIKKYEKDIDLIYYNNIYRKLINIDVANFWEGKLLSDFLEFIVKISDYIEDIADELQIIYLNV